MTVTVASFRQQFPEFTDPGVYDGNIITFYVNLAVTAFQNAFRWDPNTIDYGTCLFTAHHMVLQARANATAAATGIPGTVEGVQTSKSVDRVAVGYEIEAVTIDRQASHWNMTTYGIMFLQLQRGYGSGGYQLGAPCPIPYPLILGPL